MIYRQLGFREARKRPGRAILTLASVAIGVAAVIAVTFTMRSTQSAFDQIFQSLAGRASLEVAAPFGQSIPDRLAQTISEIPGVQAVAPRLQRPTIIYAKKKRVQVVAAAVDPQRDRVVHDYEIVAGQPLTQSDGVLLNQLLAENLGVRVGDKVFLLTRSGRIGVSVTGLFTSRTAVMSGQGAGVLIPLRRGQQSFRAPHRVDTIQIVSSPDADQAALLTEISKRLPKNAELRNPAGHSAMAAEMILATNQALQMARAFIVLVATFVIANTFLISVAQRRRQLGILRALGASRGQIAGLVLTEAAALGVAGAIVGSLLGIAISHYLNVVMGAVFQTALPPIHLTLPPFMWAAVFGLGMSLVGATAPALKAAHLEPLDALRDVLHKEIEGSSKWLVRIGAVAAAVGALLLALSIAGSVRTEVGIYAGVCGLVGLVLLLPLGLPALTRAIARVWPAPMRTESRIASRQLLIHRSRTALTVGVVFIAASAATGLASTVLDNIQDIRDWYQKTFVADFFIRATMPDLATGIAADLPDGLGDEIRAVDGVRGIDGIRLVSVKAADQNAILVVRDVENDALHQFDVVRGDEDEIPDRLGRGEVVVGSVLAARANLALGGDLPLETEQGVKRFRIAAIVNDYQAGGLTVYMDRKVAAKQLEIGGVDVYVVKADADNRQGVQKELMRLTRRHGLLLQSLSDLQGEIDAMISGVEGGLWALVALGLLIAAFGVVNTLMISVLEQTFEFGLLRAIAATRGQIRKVILAEAVILACMAMTPAVIAGIGIAYFINLSTFGVTGHMIEFRVHPLLSVAAFAAGLIAVLIAAWIPAERAARVPLGGVLRVR